MEAEKAKEELQVNADEAVAAVAATTTTSTATTDIPVLIAAKDAKEGTNVPDITSTLETHIQELPGQQKLEIPIISLSDGEDDMTSTPQTKLAKKRKSMEGGSGIGVGESGADAGEERYRLKRRKIKVAGAPKMPLTGYVRYMNDRRESLRKEYPTKTAIEHTKIIGEEWQVLTDERKAPYMKAAEQDKQRYLSELHVFLKARPDVLACELAKNKQRRSNQGVESKSVLKEKSQLIGGTNANITTKPSKETTLKEDKPRRSSEPETISLLSPVSVSLPAEKPKCKRTPTPPVGHTYAAVTLASSNTPTHSAPVPGEIPIFTNEFLEHNKVFDMELRTLRKSKADLEQQNAVLEKHVENMKFGVEKMTNENDELQEKNRLLEIYLDKLKRKLALALAGLAIPSEPNGATVDNIDKYMNDLYKMATTNTHGPASLNKAKDIIRKLDLQINL